MPANFAAEAGAQSLPIDGKDLYHRMLHEFLGTAPGSRYRGNVTEEVRTSVWINEVAYRGDGCVRGETEP